MTYLCHLLCQNPIFVDLSTIYATLGKVLVDSHGCLYVGNGTLLPKQRGPRETVDIKFFCTNCDKELGITKNADEIGGRCYNCGKTTGAMDLYAYGGYFLCKKCAKEQPKAGKLVDLTSIRIPLT